jgi:catechol 2,3-dioxygenase-like lactoylglutathione lyase family enzyme
MSFKFNHLHLIVSNLEEGISFFTELLGAELVRRRKFGPSDGAVLQLDGTGINLRLPHENEQFSIDCPPTHFGYHHIALEVEDLSATHKRLLKSGLEFTKEPSKGEFYWNAFFKGPDGILVELIEF